MARQQTRQLNISNILLITFCVVLLLFGASIMTASGIGIIPIKLSKIWLPLMLTIVAGIIIVVGFTKRLELLWLGFCVLCCCVPVWTNVICSVDYTKLYPIFLFAPAVASMVVTGVYRKKELHIIIASAFSLISCLYVLEVFDILKNFYILGGITLAIISAAVFVMIVCDKKKRQ